MATTRLSNIVEPEVFTSYVAINTAVKSALSQSGIMVRSQQIIDQLTAGAHSFTVPSWLDLADEEADYVNDDPSANSVPSNVSAIRQVVRKTFAHKSWADMNFASEMAGADAGDHIQTRVMGYWERQIQKRLIASLRGVLASNVLNNAGDMVLDITAETGDAAKFSPAAVIDAAGTLGDSMGNVTGIAMHSDKYREALKQDLIEFVRSSDGSLQMATYRGLACIVDDGLTPVGNVYTSVLFGASAVGYGVSAPLKARGTEVENLPSSGNGGGQEVLHSRINVAVQPSGFSWVEGTVTGESPSLAELASAAHWSRVVERNATPIAFLQSL